MSKEIETVNKKYMKKEDYIGKKYNHLMIVEFDHYGANSQAYFKCRCDCGNEVVVLGASIRSGNTKSCGCLKEQHKKSFGKHRKDQTTHGGCGTRLYRIWFHMRARCRDKNSELYGARGIKVFEEWDSSFELFRDWALSNGYNDNLTIDRIDVNGNYEPDNCRWADMKTQGRNRRNTLYVDFQGKRMSLKDACEIVGVDYHTVYGRIADGMSVEQALQKGRVCRRGKKRD